MYEYEIDIKEGGAFKKKYLVMMNDNNNHHDKKYLFIKELMYEKPSTSLFCVVVQKNFVLCEDTQQHTTS